MMTNDTKNYSPKEIMYSICSESPNVMYKFYSENEGFRGIYTESLDKPFLDNHLFVMYEFKSLDANWFMRDYYFTKNPLYYDSYSLYVKDKLFYVYVFINLKNIYIEKKTLPLEDKPTLLDYIHKKNQGLSVEKS